MDSNAMKMGNVSRQKCTKYFKFENAKKSENCNLILRIIQDSNSITKLVLQSSVYHSMCFTVD